MTRARAAGLLLVAAALAAIAVGLFVAGPPGDERARRLDEQRVRDLTAVAYAVDLYWTRHGALPPAEEALVAEPGAAGLPFTDPATGERYEYRPLDGDSYELCATFDRTSESDGGPPRDRFWTHAAGRQCFSRTAERVR